MKKQPLRMHFHPFHSQDCNVNYPCCLPYTSYFLIEFKRFPELLSGAVVFFQDFPVLETATLKFQDFPGLPGHSVLVVIFRTHILNYSVTIQNDDTSSILQSYVTKQCLFNK